jgi:hypothetical protein
MYEMKRRETGENCTLKTCIRVFVLFSKHYYEFEHTVELIEHLGYLCVVHSCKCNSS